jgi:hypothetical protein
VGVRDHGKWKFFRLPKASHTYDGAHGWNTEWPRIRNVGTREKPDYLMTMHGLFWHFPFTFSSENSSGIRPRSAYLKVIGDFAGWNGKLVIGCDDAAKNEFLNKRKVKGNISGPGQSNSNLWFISPETPDQLGPNNAEGAVWISENIKAGEVSEPFLYAGWDIRSAWIYNEGKLPVSFSFEIDKKGDNTWERLKTISLKADEAANVPFPSNETGEWIRVSADKTTTATIHFSYAQKDSRSNVSDPVFKGLAGVNQAGSGAGLLWDLDHNRRKLGVLAGIATNEGFTESGYYELDSLMTLEKKDDPETAAYPRKNGYSPSGSLF